jgi:hypothetical protein
VNPSRVSENRIQTDRPRQFSWAGYLIRILAGWAIEHQQGLAIGGLKSSGAPTPEMMKDPAFPDEKAALDSHVSERIGSEVNHRGQELPPERQREFSVQMAELLKCIFPGSLAEALRALEFGEVQPILQKANVEGQKRNYSEKIMQLRALEYIEYEHAKGSVKGIAQKVVQNHFGVGVEAIRKWERSLHKELGRRFVFLALSIARGDGNLVKGIRMRPDADKFQDFTETRYLNRMKLAGECFRKSLKKKQERR